MDWFYPVLAGVFQGEQGLERINARWHEFVEPGLGCRCENHQPWVTVAESCELTMALLSVGDVARLRHSLTAYGNGATRPVFSGPATSLKKTSYGR